MDTETIDTHLPQAVPIRHSTKADDTARVYWPCRVDLASPGSVRACVDITPVVATLSKLRLSEIFEMDLCDVVAVLMAPVTFGAVVGVASARLVAAAALAGVTPAQLLLCHVVTAAQNYPTPPTQGSTNA